MFSKIFRLGAVISSAAILSSCGGGSGQTLTQQDTAEGLFSGVSNVYINASGGQTGTPNCTQNLLVFVEYAGVFYSFATDPTTNALISAASGSLSFSGGIMSAASVVQVMPPSTSTVCGVAVSSLNEVTNPSLTGGYSTGVNFAGTFNYPLAISADEFQSTTFNLNYNAGYQGVQSLATLAGTYAGTIGTSQFSEAGTFTFGPASVPANSENQFGVGIISGTGASGCSYTGTVSPLFKGNGYTTSISSGGSPCRLPNTQFSGLVYLDTTKAPNYLYSFAPDQARTDGLIFTGTRN